MNSQRDTAHYFTGIKTAAAQQKWREPQKQAAAGTNVVGGADKPPLRKGLAISALKDVPGLPG